MICITNLCYISGPVLPKKMYGLRMVENSNEVIISGGYSNDGTGYQNSMHKLGCINHFNFYQGCSWEKMTTELIVPRSDHTSVVVPNKFVCLEMVQPCSVGWTLVNGNCYKFDTSEIGKTYNAAKFFCSSLQARLFEPINEQTNLAVFAAFQTATGKANNGWLGIRRDGSR